MEETDSRSRYNALMQSYLILGCGYLGTALGGKLAQAGQKVWGVRRDEHQFPKLVAAGINPWHADLLQEKPEFPGADFAVFCQAPSRKNDTYAQTYVDATRNALRAMPSRPPKVVFVSSTSVYPVRDGSWVDEKTPTVGVFESPEAQGNAKTLLEAERVVLSSGIPSCVVRLAGLYGPGRNRVRMLKEGRTKPVFDATFTNRIRLEDAASAIQLVLERGTPGEIYLACDDEPSTQRDFYSWISKELSWPSEPATAGAIAGKRYRNTKLKSLGWKPKFPNFRDGYASLLAEATV